MCKRHLWRMQRSNTVALPSMNPWVYVHGVSVLECGMSSQAYQALHEVVYPSSSTRTQPDMVQWSQTEKLQEMDRRCCEGQRLLLSSWRQLPSVVRASPLSLWESQESYLHIHVYMRSSDAPVGYLLSTHAFLLCVPTTWEPSPLALRGTPRPAMWMIFPLFGSVHVH